MSKANKFTTALSKPSKADPAPETAPPTPPTAAEGTTAVAEPPQQTANMNGQRHTQHDRPARRGTKHVGGYFDPAVSRQLRVIALEEDTTVQALLAEGIDMLFQARRKPTIASKPIQS